MSEFDTPAKIYTLRDYNPSFKPQDPIKFQQNSPILIDLGTSNFRIGFAKSTDNFLSYPTLISKFRDRKQNKTLTFVGNDVYLDPSVKNQAKSPFDGSFITNFDLIEQVLDYSFHKIGAKSLENSPIIVSEKPAQSLHQRRSFYELFYELYGVQKLNFGIDSLFSYYQNNGSQNGVVISSGHESTHVIPVLNGKGLINESKRLNFGGHHASTYLSNSLQLKYPYFPSKLNSSHIDNLVKDYCYVSSNYQEELDQYLTPENLEDNDITVEAPFVEVEKSVKTEEELQRQAEKRKESGRRLQEQAQQKRLEKLIQKEQEFEYYTSLLERIKSTMNKKQQLSTFKQEGFNSEDDLNKYLGSLEKALTKARTKDIGEEKEIEIPSFPLADVPDDQLDEDSIKEKRKQRLLKANYEARQRAKQAKLEEQQRLELEAQKDNEWRETDLKSWIHDRRNKWKAIVQRRKDRAKLREQLNDRKSLAAQQRMKNIATLASEDKAGALNNKRKRATIDNDPNDTFGANDDDWSIYRDISKDDPDEEELLEEEEQVLLKLEKELLEFDPSFTEEDTIEAQYDYKKSILHLYLRGPRPFNSEDSHEQHQIHLNTERIRIPEIIFQPSIMGLDQAGIVEIGENMLLNTFSKEQSQELLKDVFITGGNTLFKGFEERVYTEYKQFLPSDSQLRVRSAEDPLNDSWRGMAKWASSGDAKYLTKKEYDEYGPDYIKEHNLGNFNVLE